jgi:hypothetical protein
LDVTNEREIEGINDGRRGNNGSIDIIQGRVNIISPGKSICWSHFCTGENLPYDVEVLEKQSPSGLSTREFTRFLDVRQILMIGNDGYWVSGSLKVLFPFG